MDQIELIVATQLDAAVDEPRLADLFPFATRAVVKRVDRAGDLLQLAIQGIDRARLVDLAQQEPHLVARIQPLPERRCSPACPRAATSR